MALRPPSERPLVRAMAAALALAGLLMPLVAARHAADSSHIACAEHGELVEADAPVAPGVHAHVVNAATLEGEQGLPAELHGHAHCMFLAWASQSSLPGGRPPDALVSVSAVIEIIEPVRALIAPAIALIDLAPKSSPPARG